MRAGDFLEGEARERVRQRLQLFVKNEIERRLAPLFAAQALPLDGAARGLVFQLADALGCLPADGGGRRHWPRSTPQRGARWSRLGLRFGTEIDLCRAAAPAGRGSFPRAALGGPARPAGAASAGRPQPRQGDHGRSLNCRPRSMPRSAGACWPVWRCGRTGSSGSPRRARARAKAGRFAADAELAAARRHRGAGELRGVLLGLGYRAVIEGGDEFFIGTAASPRRSQAATPPRPATPREGHPFAKLKELNSPDEHDARRRRNAPKPASTNGCGSRALSKAARSRARLCTAGAVAINGQEVSKANQSVRVGDIVVLPQGGWQRTVRVVALGTRRGPAPEARTLYEEAASATRLLKIPDDWIPLLDSGDERGTASL